jgi:hypothetical protein
MLLEAETNKYCPGGYDIGAISFLILYFINTVTVTIRYLQWLQPIIIIFKKHESLISNVHQTHIFMEWRRQLSLYKINEQEKTSHFEYLNEKRNFPLGNL